MSENQTHPNAVDEALDKLLTYTFGQSREPLALIEKQVFASLGDRSKEAGLAEKLGQRLRTDASTDCKNFVCRQLGLLNQSNAIDSILGLLNYPETADHALFALERIDQPAVLEGLQKALETAPEKSRVGILLVLGKKKDPGSIPAISSYVQDKNPDCSEAAIRALGMIGGASACEELKKAEYARSPQIHRAWGNSLLQIAESFRASGDQPHSTAILQPLLASEHPFGIRKAALLGLKNSDKKSFEDALAGILSEPDGKLKHLAQQMKDSSD